MVSLADVAQCVAWLWLFILASYGMARLMLSARQSLSEGSVHDPDSFRPSSLPGEGAHDPAVHDQADVPDSVGRSVDSYSYLLAVPLPAVVTGGPDVDAFTGGVILGLSVVFIVITLLGGLAIARRILGS